ncbi:hypothetical protein ACFQZC_27720 [Streptacidiphilus monticola]
MYRHDVYFREMAALVEQRPRQDVERMLCGSSFVMFKPDAVVGRRIEPALDFLAAHGFRPTGFATVPVDARAHRELWRYQLNAAPLTIIRTVDLILESGPCLLVALRDDRRPHPAGVAAAVRLAELKGSSRNRAAGARRCAAPWAANCSASTSCTRLTIRRTCSGNWACSFRGSDGRPSWTCCSGNRPRPVARS